MARSCMTYCG